MKPSFCLTESKWHPRPFAVCIVGASGSGKTTLIERLIPVLRSKGLRVGVMKHTHHRIVFDKPGKDSWRAAEAGAEQVVLMTPDGFALMDYRPEPNLEEVVARCFEGVDIVLVEGCKGSKLPKIEVFRPEHTALPMCLDDAALLAIATTGTLHADVPTFPLDDVERIATLLVEQSSFAAT